jgi:cytoskeleton protein RodZ
VPATRPSAWAGLRDRPAGWRLDAPTLCSAAAIPGALLLFAVTAHLRSTPAAPAPVASAIAAPGSLPPPAAEPAAASPAPAAPTIRTEASSPLELTLNARSRVWVTAYADDRRVLYRLLQPGEDVTLSARHAVRIRTGNAGALSYRLNGGEPRRAGGAGEVRDLTVTREDDGRVALR